MNRGIITISEMGAVIMPTAPVWMTKFEIADLFGVFSCDVHKAIHSIYKNKELNEADTMRYIRQLDGISYDVYNLEMVIAVAFSPPGPAPAPGLRFRPLPEKPLPPRRKR